MSKQTSTEQTRRAPAAKVTVASARRIATSVAELRAAERRAMIADAAYFRAERRGFAPGHEMEDWLAAEIELTKAQREASNGFQD